MYNHPLKIDQLLFIIISFTYNIHLPVQPAAPTSKLKPTEAAPKMRDPKQLISPTSDIKHLPLIKQQEYMKMKEQLRTKMEKQVRLVAKQTKRNESLTYKHVEDANKQLLISFGDW